MERPPTAEESALNPTRTIQYEFQDFLKKTEGPLASYETTADGRFQQTEFGKLMSGPGCQRKHFYLSLLELRRTNTQKSIERFNTCAREGVNGNPNPVNPVDAAIKCYSILISHLMSQGKGSIAWSNVCIVLMKDYRQTTEGEKTVILDLILSDAEAYAAAPQGIKDEIQREVESGRLTSAHRSQGAQGVGILFPTRLDFSGAAAGPAGTGGKRKSKKSKSKSKIAKKSSKKNMKKSRRLKKKSKISRKNK